MNSIVIPQDNMKIIRTNSSNRDFIELTSRLDTELKARYGSKQSEYDKHNKIDPIKTAIIGYLGKTAVACGCFKSIDGETIEIKRMYVECDHRRKGFSMEILKALENWASELGFSKVILETGKGQPEAIALYKKCGYHLIKNFGPYKNMKNSICMEKPI
jgi:putative acetyltransferase